MYVHVWKPISAKKNGSTASMMNTEIIHHLPFVYFCLCFILISLPSPRSAAEKKNTGSQMSMIKNKWMDNKDSWDGLQRPREGKSWTASLHGCYLSIVGGSLGLMDHRS